MDSTQEVAALKAEISLLKQSVERLQDQLEDAEISENELQRFSMLQTDILLKHGYTQVGGIHIG
jgi:hypothetical protein